MIYCGLIDPVTWSEHEDELARINTECTMLQRLVDLRRSFNEGSSYH
jgi:hypothetical protein